MRSHYSSIALLILAAGFLPADPITYDVSIDTSSVSGDAGSLDFQFNPGPFVTQDASLQILNFSSGGTVAGSPILTGDVSGALPGTLTFDNLTGFNDYFEGFTFGSTLSFQVSLYGPALSSPDGISTSGSAFAFSMFSDPGGITPVLTFDTSDGFASVINLNLDGSTSVSNYSDQTSIAPEGAAVPEPTTLGFLAAAMAVMFLRTRSSVRA